MIPPEAKALLGRVLESKLELTDYLGAGAVGWVFKAHHRRLNKRVAIKVLQSTEFGPTQRERFALEAQAAAQFDHPNSVRVLDFGQDQDGLLYIAMEYLQGKDLSQVLEVEGPMNGPRLAKLMLQALGALAAAHDQGVIHRDIKSANIMLLEGRDDDGLRIEQVKVLDFGLAKLVNLGGQVALGGETQPGMVMGTPYYMSPEQAVGEPLDPKTDVYSAGVVMFEMLTGKVPFVAEQPMLILLKQIQEEPPRLTSIVPSIHPALERIVLQALAKNREERPSARDLRRSLSDFLKLEGERGTTSDVRVPIYQAREAVPDIPMLSPTQMVEAAVEALPLDAILGVVEPAPAPRSSNPQTTDDLFALVTESISDVVAEQKTTKVQEQGGIAGLDHRKHGSAVADLAREVFKTYGIWLQPRESPHALYVRDPQDRLLGPLDYKDAVLLVKKIGERGEGHLLHLSAGGRWMNATEFVKLTGQEALLRHPPLPNPKAPFYGSLRATSLPSLCLRITKDKLTGRMYFKRGGDAQDGRLEIHLVLGAPTFVLSDLLDLELPSMLLQKGLITQEMLPKFIFQVIRTGQTLGAVLASEIGLEIEHYQALFMRETIAELVRWRGHATYSFDHQVLPGRMQPLAPSMFALLPELVYRTMTPDELRFAISPYLDQALERSERFNGMVAALALTPQQIAVAKRFGSPRTIAQAMGGALDNKMQLTLAYIMVESGMLLKPLAAI